MRRSAFHKRLRELGYSSYHEYLASPHWQAVRQRYFASRLYRGSCAGCGAHGPLDLHHRTYKRLGREWLMDLLALCRACHDRVHETERASSSLWVATRKVARRRRARGGTR